MTLPTISVVVINLNGKHYLEACFTSLLNQNYPADLVELILVENGSHDGSSAFVAERFPTVQILQNAQNVGFAPAVNQGAAAASGHYLALINNDAHAHPDWLREMVELLERNRERGVVCVGAKMLDLEGRHIDFGGGAASFYGIGYQFFYRLPVEAARTEEQDMLFACGGAMLVERDIFLRTGGFDDDYFAYYEDVDFGWRLWLCGYRVMFAPRAIVYHRHHGTSGSIPHHQKLALLERNALMTVIKNYDDANLHRVLGASFLLLAQRCVAEAGDSISWETFNFADTSDTTPSATHLAVPKTSLSYLAALKQIMDRFPAIWEKRQRVQQQRQCPDTTIFPLLGFPLGMYYFSGSQPYLRHYLMDSFNFQDLSGGSRIHRALIISTDPLYENLAGPGIRTVEMARYLAQHCYVTLAVPRQATITIPGVELVVFTEENEEAIIRSLASQTEMIILQGFSLYRNPYLETMRKVLVVDMYDPFHLESLEFFKHETVGQGRAILSAQLQVVTQQLRAGDFFICASERQRDFWLGMLSSLGRLAPECYAQEPTFRTLIDVVPFGIDPNPPVHHKPVLKGVVPGIGEQDTVVLWGGGIWDWLDPLTVVRAMAQVRQQRPDIKLFFMGYHHPNPVDVPKMKLHNQVVALVAELGLEQTVFFNDHWVAYHERANYFLEADIGVSAHLHHIETRYAFRTRLLDYIWAGLPMIVSSGDTLADLVDERGLGHVVAIQDVDGFAQAILALATQPQAREARAPAFADVRQQFVWPRAFAPLIAFCTHPRRAPDRDRLTLVDTHERRIEELDEIIAQKNQHIARLEDLLRRIEAGRLMRLLRWFNERRTRKS